MSSIGNRRLNAPKILDEGVVILPFAFQINGVTTPNNVQGDCVASRSVGRTSAGLFTFTLTDKPFAVVGGGITCSCGATEDITPHLDASVATTTGVITIRTFTGATATDPSDDSFVYGHLLVKMIDRRALAV